MGVSSSLKGAVLYPASPMPRQNTGGAPNGLGAIVRVAEARSAWESTANYVDKS
jgi:hypothetical protein